MRDALRQVKPTEFEDLIALVALYRPGPMQYIPSYAARKNGREPITYIDERLRAITQDSQGICIYQEQYLQIAKSMAGFTGSEAETLRRAIGKKIHELMASLKPKFLDGCAANNVTPSVANQLWKDMESSQDYSFNKAHSVCYALIAYRTAWLKANHPCEYMAALISSVMNTKDRGAHDAQQASPDGDQGVPPDVKRVGHRLRRRRGEDPLRSQRGQERRRQRRAAAQSSGGGRTAAVHDRIWDRTSDSTRRPSTRRALESLVKCGALDSTGSSRMGMLGVLENALAYGQKLAADRLAGQGSIFDLGFGDAEPAAEVARRIISRSPRASSRRPSSRAAQKETLGLYVSEHPLSAVRDQLRRKTDATLGELERRRDGEPGDRRRHRLGHQAPDDEEGRGDGVPPARGSHRHGRGRRLRRHLRAGARAVRDRPDPRRQGPRRPQAAGGDEADRARADARSRRSPSGAMCASGSTPARPLPARSRSSPGSCRSTPASRPCTSRSTRHSAPARSLSPRVPRPAGLGLHRRGEGAARRSVRCPLEAERNSSQPDNFRGTRTQRRAPWARW